MGPGRAPFTCLGLGSGPWPLPTLSIRLLTSLPDGGRCRQQRPSPDEAPYRLIKQLLLRGELELSRKVEDPRTDARERELDRILDQPPMREPDRLGWCWSTP